MKNPSPRRSFLSLFLVFIALFVNLSSAQVYQGCYAVDNSLVLNDTSIYQSTGRCNGQTCAPMSFAVYGLTAGSQCWCGNSIPKKQVTPDHCNLACPGYPSDNCGGTGFINVWLTGVGKLQGNAATTLLSSAPSTTKSSTPSNTVYITTGQTTITQVPSQTGKSKSGGISGGAAAGIVIAVLLIIGGGAGAFFYMRRRRNDAYQKYEGSSMGSSPGSLNRPFGVDQRLEPGMVQKRESVGSLADEQDYSRKILRVTNPDGS